MALFTLYYIMQFQKLTQMKPCDLSAALASRSHVTLILSGLFGDVFTLLLSQDIH